MLVTGLVITVQNFSDSLESELASEPRLALGERTENRLPAVLETETDAEGRQLHRWLESLPHVLAVDVVFVGHDDEEEETPRTAISL